MCFAMMLLKELELFASAEFVALPAAPDIILSTALSYLTLWRPAVSSARLCAPHFHHCTQQVVHLADKRCGSCCNAFDTDCAI